MSKPRTPPREVPSDEFDEDQPTPPPVDAVEATRRLWPLRNAGDQLVELSSLIGRLDARVAAIERMAGNISDAAEIREEVMSHVIDIKGQSGNNGKLGMLTKRVDELAAKVEKDAQATTGHNRWMIGLAIPLILAISAGALAMRDETKSARRDIDQVRRAQDRTDERIGAVDKKLDALFDALITEGKNP